ncbi:MAG: adenylate/guanylate cyclase domain-containing protein [Arenibacterium sp.]
MVETRQERKLTTILSADVVGYSNLMSKDESGTLTALKALRRDEIDPRVSRHGGRTIKLMGDGSLIEFASVVDAVRFAVDVQHALAAADVVLPSGERVRFRIGINVGDVIVDGADIYGDGVNVAARIEGLAEPGGICISRTVFDHVNDKLNLTFTAMGLQQLKNIPSPLYVYRIELDARSKQLVTASRSQPPEPSEKTPTRNWWRWVAAAVLVMTAMAATLYLIRSGSTGPPVIAVLPFHDVSPEEQRGLLSDPLSDGILAHLARYPELTVIARGSSFRFRGNDRDLREIGKQLGADYLLEGSLNFDGEKVAVNAALIDVSKNAQVWSDLMSSEINDLMRVIAEIGQRVAYQVEDYVGQVQVAEPGLFRAEALLMTQQARKATMRGGPSKENNAAVIEMNRKTIALYPDDAWGHLAMAFALRTKVRFGWADDTEATLATAVEHAEKAVRLAPDNYSAFFALGRVRLQQGEHARAIEALDTALRLNPSSADALNALAQTYFYLGDNDRALQILAQSARIDPLPSFVHAWVSAWVLWQDERCDEANEAFLKITSPPPAAHKLASVIEICLGQAEDARRALEVYLKTTPAWTVRKEIALQEAVWRYEPGLQRWVDNLTQAGLPVQ